MIRLLRSGCVSLCWVLIAMTSVAGAASLTPLPSPRKTLDLNGAWTLSLGEFQVDITVPKTIAFFFTPTTWRRNFTLDIQAAHSVAYLHFGGVVNSAVVKLNGLEVGRLLAFTETRLDVARALNPRGHNVLEVVVDDRLTEESIPGGPTLFFAQQFGPVAYTFPVAWANKPGIIRDVSLVYSNQPVIADANVFQSFNNDLSTLNLLVSVRTVGLGFGERSMAAEISLPGGVATCSSPVVQDGEMRCTITIASPRLWSPQSPMLHDLKVTYYFNEQVADSGTDRIGFRKFESRGQRFYLNNRPVFLRGISRHDIYPEGHFVLDEQVMIQDLKRIKALGLNFVRSIHYPAHEAFVKKADEVGLLVSEEIPAWASLELPGIVPNAAEMLTSLVNRDHNRASVVMYFVGSGSILRTSNEYLDEVLPIVRRLDPSKQVSFLSDDPALTTPAVVKVAAELLKRKGATFFSVNAYWHESVFAQALPAIPADMPFVATEWTGGEGSDRGPIGSGETTSFPNRPLSGDGESSEVMQAGGILESFQQNVPFLCSSARTQECIAGTMYFLWQDVEWPAMPIFYKNHYPMLRNGLVYEDRAEKRWPAEVFKTLVQFMPQ